MASKRQVSFGFKANFLPIRSPNPRVLLGSQVRQRLALLERFSLVSVGTELPFAEH